MARLANNYPNSLLCEVSITTDDIKAIRTMEREKNSPKRQRMALATTCKRWNTGSGRG